MIVALSGTVRLTKKVFAGPLVALVVIVTVNVRVVAPGANVTVPLAGT